MAGEQFGDFQLIMQFLVRSFFLPLVLVNTK